LGGQIGLQLGKRTANSTPQKPKRTILETLRWTEAKKHGVTRRLDRPVPETVRTQFAQGEINKFLFSALVGQRAKQFPH